MNGAIIPTFYVPHIHPCYGVLIPDEWGNTYFNLTADGIGFVLIPDEWGNYSDRTLVFFFRKINTLQAKIFKPKIFTNEYTF
ncbi:hypothetical protein JF568_06560 [Alysiella filiformis DSM 16848]|uniref:hypothetical protein n=1 Tax=Alysiella filiformis TaxID=194196 RepID=UPI0015F7176D|nr:hypothetical protein [Alysiella filiformis]QMT31715.1 hypothetical protein H3L97_02115 [Alysiella filiformis]UBQ55274.1 hypothetical protein JF568_06560 [Alysiella filiformis DSM 16848]